MKIHHIGIVVNDIQESLGEFSKFVKFEETTIPTLINSQKVNVCFMSLGEFRIELIEPINEESPVSNFLTKGGGFHHICFEVENLNTTIEKMTKKGGRLIVSPVKGFEGRQIAFIFLNMKKTNFNLIELVESKYD
ncbi:VOC family protein [Nitrosopumilus sp.]|uniref:VOC family protein n=1 Tax=Nitrosopumilus sp. TaxID=2024843 RepID=UPI003D107132